MLPDEVNGYFAEMGRIAVALGGATTRGPRNPRSRARGASASTKTKRWTICTAISSASSWTAEWKHGVAAAVDVTLLGRFYERFADHAVEVGRRVIFLVTGKLPTEEDIRELGNKVDKLTVYPTES